MEKWISKSIFYFSILIIKWKNQKQKKFFLSIYFYLKSISKNRNHNFQIHFFVLKSRNKFQKILSFFNFGNKSRNKFQKILSFFNFGNRIENWKMKKLKICFVFKSKNELYFWCKNPWVKRTFAFCSKKKWNFEFFSFIVFIIKSKNEFQILISIFTKNWKMNVCLIFYEIFSVLKHSSDKSYHLNYS